MSILQMIMWLPVIVAAFIPCAALVSLIINGAKGHK